MGFKSIEERNAVVEAARNWPQGVSGAKWYSDAPDLCAVQDRIDNAEPERG